MSCFAATPGLDDSGTVMRVDGVSLPLRPVRYVSLLDRAAMAGGHQPANDNYWECVILMPTLRIAGGRVVDPANGVNDEVRDLWIDGGG